MSKWKCEECGTSGNVLGRDREYDSETGDGYLIWYMECPNCGEQWEFQTETDRY